MAGKHFTRCVSRANYDGLCGVFLPNLVYMLGYGIIEAILGFIIGAGLGGLLGEAACFELAGAVAGFVWGLADGLQDRYENRRLICISDDECALGRVAYHKTGPSKGFPEAIDNDFTMNLILVPHAQDTDQNVVFNDAAQGQRLLRRQFNDLSYEGYDPPNATLHCEFEGSRLRSVCNALRAAAPALGGAACICMFVPPLVCIALILAILAIFGLSGWFGGEDGSPADAATDPESGTVEDGDCVVVRGVHVYDAGHCEGWHEIHPVLHVQKVCGKDDPACIAGACFEADPTDPIVQQRVNDLVDAWCFQLGQPQEPIVIERQKAPENRWVFHPDVDGCRVPEPIP